MTKQVRGLRLARSVMRVGINKMRRCPSEFSLEREWGLTIVELMVTIAVLAILAAIAAPSFVNLIRENQAASVSNELLGAVQLARGEAIKRMKDVDVSLSIGENGWTAEVAEGATTIRSINHEVGTIEIGGDATITFDYLGRVKDLDDHILSLSHSSDSSIARSLIVEPSGRSCIVRATDASGCD